MAHTFKFKITQKEHANIIVGVFACLFIIGLWLSLSIDITTAYYTGSPIVDESASFGEDLDSPDDDEGASAPVAIPIFQGPLEFFQHSLNSSQCRSVYLTTYPATGPPSARQPVNYVAPVFLSISNHSSVSVTMLHRAVIHFSQSQWDCEIT